VQRLILARRIKNVVLGAILLAPIGIGLVRAQNGAGRPDTKPLPDQIQISKADAAPFREQARDLERTSLQLRALTAELRLAQQQIKELQATQDSQQKATQTSLFTLCEKAGIPKERLAEYDLTEEPSGGLKLTKRADVAPVKEPKP
jgi:hypothetical protein